MALTSVSQTHDLDKTMEIAKKYAKRGHIVQIRLVDFQYDSAEHKALEWEVWVDFDVYLCYNCKKMKDAMIHGINEFQEQNYCDDCYCDNRR